MYIGLLFTVVKFYLSDKEFYTTLVSIGWKGVVCENGLTK